MRLVQSGVKRDVGHLKMRAKWVVFLPLSVVECFSLLADSSESSGKCEAELGRGGRALLPFCRAMVQEAVSAGWTAVRLWARSAGLGPGVSRTGSFLASEPASARGWVLSCGPAGDGWWGAPSLCAGPVLLALAAGCQGGPASF